MHPRLVQVETLVRTMIGVRALSGRPDRLLGAPAGATGTAVVRVLGTRQLVQAGIVERTGWHALSAAVDLLHGASMLALLAVAPRHRRFAAAQAGTAAALIALELLADRRG